jgi:predicted metalloprotease with PDZ domain
LKLSSRTIASIVVAFLPVALPAQQKSVDYDISFPNAAQHEARVTATFRGIPAGTTLQVRMSQSSPGRYARSTFAKNVYDVAIVDGKGKHVDVTRPDTHGWNVTGHDGTVKVSYIVWGDRIDGTYLSVDHSHAHINMPATFMFAHGMDTAPIRLTIHPRPDWKIATQLAPTRDPNVFTAPNMQWFMDSPTEVGPVSVRSWSETHGGRKSTWNLAMHHLGTEAQLDSFSVMVRRVVDEQIAMWGEPAGYDLGTYTFLVDYVPWADGDGMEHRNSTVVTDRESTIADRAKRIESLSTISHEFFHSWNMERLRSKEIEPFDFDREDISDGLWFGEGFTNYYGPLLIRRAGFYSDEEFIRGIGGAIVSTINSSARRHGSPVDMSRQAPFFDGARYLDPLNRTNTFISYYTWGSVVAVGLDLTLRERFNTTLDDFMRVLWQNRGRHQSAAFAPERPYTVRDLRNELGTFTRDTAFANDFFRRYVEGREVPDFSKLLEPAGFHLAVDSVDSPWFGASLDNDTAKVFVNWSQEGSSAYDAGLASGDYVIAVDGMPVVSVDSLNTVIANHKVGDVVQLDVLQKTVRKKIPMTIRGRRGMKVVSYESAGMTVTDAMRVFRRSWLGSRIQQH